MISIGAWNLVCTGLNSYLVNVCVEFLKQEDPMNEEGLFRVPGDSAVIKRLHEQFMTFPQDKEELRLVGKVSKINHVPLFVFLSCPQRSFK